MIKEYFDQAGFSLTDQQADQFRLYLEAFLDWNKKINLSGITDEREVVIKHFVDSVVIARFVDFSLIKRTLDVGTGGGLPGIPLAILYPGAEFVLLDSTAKKLRVVEDIVRRLGLTNVKVLWGRAEQVSREKEIHENFNLVVARAVAELPTLLRWCLPFVKPKHYFVAYKGPQVEQEIPGTEKILTTYCSKLDKRENFILPEAMGERTLLFYKKLRPSPK